MTTFVLIMVFYAGAMSSTDSVSISSVGGFQTSEACREAGEAAKKEFSTAVKPFKFVCVSAK